MINKINKTCYMCGEAKTSNEHVPPRCLFPKQNDFSTKINFRKNLIKVPSCDIHNSQKSKDDEYILYTLVMSIPNNKTAENHFLNKIRRAIERNPSLINKILEKQVPVYAHDTANDHVHKTIAVKVDMKRFNSSMEHMGRALYFYHFNEKWLGKISVHPDFMLLSVDPNNAREKNEPNENMTNLSNILFSGKPYYGENPEVFMYQVVDGKKGVQKIMRLQFYGGSNVTLFFKNDIKTALV